MPYFEIVLFKLRKMLFRIFFISFIFASPFESTAATLGSYPSSSVTSGGNIIVSPNAAPGGVSSLQVLSSTSFTGVLTANPITGIVSIVDAKPAGSYTISVSAGNGVIESFLLTVANPTCSQGNFINAAAVSVSTNPYYVAIGEFNNDGNQDILVANSGTSAVSIRLGNGTGGFTGTTSVTVGSAPTSIVVGDFNRDGKQDFASSNNGTNTVSIRLGNGLGGFTGTNNIVVSNNPIYMAMGDFNKDGLQDIAVSHANSPSVSILLGDGLGGFTNSITLTVGNAPRTIVVGDFNNDGNADLAIANSTSASVSIKLGDGSGGFIDNGSLTGLSVWAIAIGDFNNDNIQDLAIGSGANVVTRLGNGLGGFTTGSSVTLLNASMCVAVGDFNSDGLQDIAVPQQSSNIISIRFGNGTGGFTGTTNISSTKSFWVAVGDFNKDGIQDLVSANNLSATAPVYLGADNGEINLQGSGTNISDGSSVTSTANNTNLGTTVIGLAISKSFTVQNTGSGPLIVNSITKTGASTTDFTISGITLPATLNGGTSTTFTIAFNPASLGVKTATIHVNNNDCSESDYDFAVQGVCDVPSIGNYSDTTIITSANISRFPSASPLGISSIKVVAPPEFKGIITTNSATGLIRFTNSQPAGVYLMTVIADNFTRTFTLTVNKPICSTASFSNATDVSVGVYGRSIAIGDFNNDNIQDFATCDYNSNLITVKKGLGNGAFTNYTTLSITNPYSIAIADINKDGFQDIAATRPASGNVAIFLGNGTGFTTGTSVTTGTYPYGLAFDDYNSDNKIDLAITVYPANAVLIKLGDGAGLFSGSTSVAVGNNPLTITLADFNRDGKVDFATGNYYSNNISVRYGDGIGGFNGNLQLSVLNAPATISSADFNRDSFPDIVVNNNYTTYFQGNGSGGFNAGVNLAITGYENAMTQADLNGDGFLDIVMPKQFLLGNGNGAFGPSNLLNTTDNPPALAVGDFNADGVQDLAITTNTTGKVFIRLGTIQSLTVKGNGIVIANGSSSTSTINNTNMGIVAIGSSVSRTFVIKNPGGDSITLNNISFTGSGSSEYSSSGFTLPLKLKGNDSIAVRVYFSPVSAGTKFSILHVNFTQCSVVDYNFALTASGSSPVIGSYLNASVRAGNDTILPTSTIPVQNNLSITAPPEFNGKVFIDQQTWAVHVVNAKPEGVYTLTIHDAGNLSTSFILTVLKPLCSSGVLNNSGSISTNTYCMGLDLGDFNNDGKADILTLSTSQWTPSAINFGDGNGNFNTKSDIVMMNYPTNVVSADFNRDGNLDLALLDLYDSLLTVEIGDGAGNFSFYTEIQLPKGPSNLIIGDINSDHFSDLLISYDYDYDSITVLQGNGLGNFSITHTLTCIGTPQAMVRSDFNNDGKMDFASVNYSFSSSDNISIWMGDGLGNFVNDSNIHTHDFPYDIVSTDFNNDGNEDLAAFIAGSSKVIIALGNGNGKFTLQPEVPAAYNSNYYGKLATGDFNGDGFADVAVAYLNFSKIEIFLGNGLGGLVSSTSINTGMNPRELIVADFNKDGIEDIVTNLYTNFSTGNIRLLIGAINGIQIYGNSNIINDGSTVSSSTNMTDMGVVSTLAPVTKIFTLTNSAADSLIVTGVTFTGLNAAEFNANENIFPIIIPDSGSVNLKITCTTNVTGVRNATVHVNNFVCVTNDYDFAIKATGIVANVPDYPSIIVSERSDTTVAPLSTPVNAIPLIVSAPSSFNGVLTINQSTGIIQVTNPGPIGVYNINVSYQTMTKSFQLTVMPPNCATSFTLSSTISSGNLPSSVAILDFNGDGKQDIAIGRMFEDPSNYTEVKFGNGLGSFSSSYNIPAAGAVSSIAVSDFNNDGFQDIAAALYNQNAVRISQGNGSGALINSFLVSVSSNPGDIAIADFNKDGWVDFVTANPLTNNLSIRLGTSSNTFTSISDITVGTAPKQLAIGDLNMDGNSDITVTNGGSSSVSVLFGNGNGTFTLSATLNTSLGPQGIVIMDYNNDGKPDIVVATTTSHVLNSYSNNGVGGFPSTGYDPNTNDIYDLCAGDFNGDGLTDVLGTNKTSSFISLFRSNGTYLSSTATYISNGTIAIAIGDFDSDNIVDFVSASTDNNNVLVNLGVRSSVTVAGNYSSIIDGSTTVSATNFTDFGTVNYGEYSDHLFYVQNNGYADISIDSIRITGTIPSAFNLIDTGNLGILQAGYWSGFTINCLNATVGNFTSTVHVYFTSCGIPGDYDFAIHVNKLGGPALALYEDITVVTGQDTSVVPILPPLGISTLTATTNTNFTGVLTADPITGIVKISNAKREGVYLITVQSGSILRTFNLTISNPLCSQAGFKFAATTTGGTRPYGIAIGDFNEDGFQDLVTANFNSADISIRYGDGVGGFAFASPLTAGNSAIAVAVGDFNGDGNQDIATAVSGSALVSTRLGNGSGSFGSAGSFSVGSSPYSIATGDFNKDGKLDIATANQTSNTVSIRLGSGTGTFTGTTEISVGTSPRSVAIGDFNNDGNPDFATANYSSNTVSIRLGNGAGAFSGSTNISVGTNPTSVSISDFNSDGIQDFAAANYNSNTVSIRLGNGTGLFTGSTNLTVGSKPFNIAAGDFNGDGKQDVAVTNQLSNTVSLCIGNGTGSFTVMPGLDAGAEPYTLAVGDFNKDGRQDLAITNYTPNNVVIRLGKDDGLRLTSNGNNIPDDSTAYSISNNTDMSFVPLGTQVTKTFTIQNNSLFTNTIQSITLSGSNTSPFSISGISLPVNLIAGASTTFSIVFAPTIQGFYFAHLQIQHGSCQAGSFDVDLRGTGGLPTLGSYPAASVVTSSSIAIIPATAPTLVTALTASTTPDFKGIITADPSTGVIKITNAKPAGIYTVKVAVGNTVVQTFILTVVKPACSAGIFRNSTSTITTTSSYQYNSAIGDFNNDNKQDLALPNLLSDSITIRMGDGLGGFSVTKKVSVGHFSRFIAIGDFNGDGKQDFVSANTSTNTVSIRIGDGAGNFSGTSEVSVGSGPVSIVLADFNNDGYQDFATVNELGNNVTIGLGNGSAGFSISGNISVGTLPESIETGDFNSDGKIDLAVANYNSSTVSILLGNGSGGFAVSNLTVGTNPNSVTVGDFNKDGKQDLAISNKTSNSVSVRLGNGLGGFSGFELTGFNSPVNVTVGDFNGDGSQDLCVSLYSNQQASVILGNGSGGFNGGTVTNISALTNFVTIGDFNNDNIQDLVAANSGTISIRLGVDSPAIVRGGLNSIIDGSTTLSTTHNTDFGSVPTGNTVVKDFYFENLGADTLILNGISLTGLSAGDYTYSGIIFPYTLQGDSSVKFSVAFTPQAGGVRSATVHISFSQCSLVDYDYSIGGVGVIQSLGTYSDTTVVAGNSVSLLPNALPAGFTKLTAITSTGFTGIITADPVTGLVRVSDAKPAGIYLVKLYATGFVIRTFTLTVTNPVCSQGYLNGTNNISLGSQPNSIKAGDFNKDGKIDFVTANYVANITQVSLGDGLGGFGSVTSYTTLTNPSGLAIGDLNGDGNQDFATANNSGTVSMRFGNGSGGFTSPNSVTVEANARKIAIGDFNNDGRQDFITTSNSSANVTVRVNDVNGNFVNPVSFPAYLFVGGNLGDIVIGDFNKDGNQDFAAGGFQNSSVYLMFGDGLGNFSGTLNFPVGNFPGELAIADLNNDGNQDLLVANTGATTVSVLIGNGIGGFSSNNFFNLGVRADNLSVGDFNGDGKQDMVVSNYQANKATLWLGNGVGSFNGSSVITTGTAPIQSMTGDFNRDSILDIAMLNNGSNNVSIRLGQKTSSSVTGNGFTIVDGSAAVSIINNTDLGSVNINTPLYKLFRIKNPSASIVIVNSCTFTGASPTMFKDSAITYPITINAGDSLSFYIRYKPTTGGIHNAIAHINLTECGVVDYDFAIRGTSICTNPAFSSCPSTQTVFAGAGLCSEIVNYVASTTGSPVPSLSYQFSGATSMTGTGSGSGSVFNRGTTNVVLTANNGCSTSNCLFTITVVADTNDNNVCTIDACNLISGMAIHTPVTIDDSNACTLDACDALNGVSHIPVIIDDGIICTTDACDPVTGISHLLVSEICGNGIDDDCNGLIDERCNEVLNIKLFIQGFYLGNNLMRATIDESSYPLICDTLEVELRSASSPFNILFSDKRLLNISGECSFLFPYSVLGNSYYIVTRHRNAIQTWSSSPIYFSDSIMNYSFADSMQQAFGNNLFDLGDGNYSLWSGDISNNATNTYGIQDGLIDMRDYNYMELNVYSTIIGYTPADLTGDGIVESLDYVFMENAFYFMIATIHP